MKDTDSGARLGTTELFDRVTFMVVGSFRQGAHPGRACEPPTAQGSCTWHTRPGHELMDRYRFERLLETVALTG